MSNFIQVYKTAEKICASEFIWITSGKAKLKFSQLAKNTKPQI